MDGETQGTEGIEARVQRMQRKCAEDAEGVCKGWHLQAERVMHRAREGVTGSSGTMIKGLCAEGGTCRLNGSFLSATKRPSLSLRAGTLLCLMKWICAAHKCM